MTCTNGSCGNGFLDLNSNEECDDGNILSNDGCSSSCKIEANFRCSFSAELDHDVCTCGPLDIESFIRGKLIVVRFNDPTFLFENDIGIKQLIYRKTVLCKLIFEETGFYEHLSTYCFIYADNINHILNITSLIKHP